jgi:hypothetical protein
MPELETLGSKAPEAIGLESGDVGWKVIEFRAEDLSRPGEVIEKIRKLSQA